MTYVGIEKYNGKTFHRFQINSYNFVRVTEENMTTEQKDLLPKSEPKTRKAKDSK